jgi:hypothetical protein
VIASLLPNIQLYLVVLLSPILIKIHPTCEMQGHPSRVPGLRVPGLRLTGSINEYLAFSLDNGRNVT